MIRRLKRAAKRNAKRRYRHSPMSGLKLTKLLDTIEFASRELYESFSDRWWMPRTISRIGR